MDIAYQREIKRVCPTHSGPGRMPEPALFPQKHRVAPGPYLPADSVTLIPVKIGLDLLFL